MQFGAFDDFDNPVAGLGRGSSGTWTLIAGIGEDSNNGGIKRPRACIEHKCCTVAILDAGRMHGGAQQQTQRVYENVAFLALDLLSGIVAMRIDAHPPFSALFTLWLSMIAALGLASRSSCSLHST